MTMDANGGSGTVGYRLPMSLTLVDTFDDNDCITFGVMAYDDRMSIETVEDGVSSITTLDRESVTKLCNHLVQALARR